MAAGQNLRKIVDVLVFTIGMILLLAFFIGFFSSQLFFDIPAFFAGKKNPGATHRDFFTS